MYNSTGSESSFSIYLLPATFAVINMIACYAALFACSLDESLYNSSWNILYAFWSGNVANDNSATTADRQHFVYIVRIVYYFRKTTIDFAKTNITLRLIEANDFSDQPSWLCVPAKFFEPNKHNAYTRESGIVKFLLIRDATLKPIEKIAITHDNSDADLYVSMVDIHSASSTDGYIGCFEKCIKPLAIMSAGVEAEQTVVTTEQSNMELEDAFAVTQHVLPSEFICSLYLVGNIVSYQLANYLQYYFWDASAKQAYPMYSSIEQACQYALGHCFFIFGLMSIVCGVTKYLLNGKPIKFAKIIYFYEVVVVVAGATWGICTVSILDPDYLLYWIKDGSMMSHFLQYWAIAVMCAMGVALFYVTSLYVTCSIFISLIFAEDGNAK